jgi:molybdopterin-containing oxidoreductase family membrane subunit
MRDLVTPAWAVIGFGLVFGGAVALWEVFVSHSFATNDGLVWSLPLVTYIFLALMSTGVSIVLAYGLIKKNDAIVSQTRALLVLAIGLLVGGFTALATELGSVSNLIWILLSPNPTSPIWWMGTLYSIELLLLAIKLILDLLGRHGPIDTPLAWGTLLIAIGAAITMGAVFGTVTARAGYAGSYASLLTLAVALAGLRHCGDHAYSAREPADRQSTRRISTVCGCRCSAAGRQVGIRRT